MSIVQRHPAVRWIAPAVAVGGVVAAQFVSASATAGPTLPERTPEQLVQALLTSHVAGYSGTVESVADLGLPALPASMTSPSSNLAGLPLQLLTGTHTLKVWTARGEGGRVAVIGEQAETDLVANRTDAWVWNSADKTVQHADLAALRRRAEATHAKGAAARTKVAAEAEKAAEAAEAKKAAARLRSYTPEQIASAFLAKLGPSTAVSSSDNTTVAGRAAYDLVLTPKTAATKIGSVHVAVDAETSMALRVEVFAKGASSPALKVGFTNLSYDVPPASTFTFAPPEGATVTELAAKAGHRSGEPGDGAKPSPSKPQVKVVGTDWASVVVADSDEVASPKPRDTGAPAELMAALPTVSGTWGRGHLVDTALFSAVITDDGRIAAGAVEPGSLYSALGAK